MQDGVGSYGPLFKMKSIVQVFGEYNSYCPHFCKAEKGFWSFGIMVRNDRVLVYNRNSSFGDHCMGCI
jgi:hypothetical protein